METNLTNPSNVRSEDDLATSDYDICSTGVLKPERKCCLSLHELHLLAEQPLEVEQGSIFHVGRCWRCLRLLHEFLKLREEVLYLLT